MTRTLMLDPALMPEEIDALLRYERLHREYIERDHRARVARALDWWMEKDHEDVEAQSYRTETR